MNYNFPSIETLSQVEKAIAGRDEFIVAEREFGFVVNYLVNLIDTFPEPNTNDVNTDTNLAIRRECRGIKFDKNGNIIARPYAKFFNLGEKEETNIKNVDFNVPFTILEKLDGSMVHPINMDGQVVYCTKMGITDIVKPVQQFADAKGHKAIFYNDFCWDLIKSGMTPIFEWVSRKQRIVIDYPEDNLILTAIRRMVNGEYLTMDKLASLANPYNVPIVKCWTGDFNGIESFLDNLSNIENEEGYVIRFNNGHMVKCKTSWYVQLHKIKEDLSQEKNVIAMIINNTIDDAKPFMTEEDKKRVDKFSSEIFNGINSISNTVDEIVALAKQDFGDDKKQFALRVMKNYKSLSSLLFKVWDGKDSYVTIKEHILKNLGSQTKVDSIRYLIGNARWIDYIY